MWLFGQEPLDGDEVGRPGLGDLVVRAVADPVVHHDDRLRLEPGDLVVEFLTVETREDGGDINPDFADRAILGQEFLDLRALARVVKESWVSGTIPS